MRSLFAKAIGLSQLLAARSAVKLNCNLIALVVRAAVAKTSIVRVGLDEQKTAQHCHYNMHRLIDCVTEEIGYKNRTEANRHHRQHALLAVLEKAGNQRWCTKYERDKRHQLIAQSMINLMYTDQRQNQQRKRNHNAINQADDRSHNCEQL